MTETVLKTPLYAKTLLILQSLVITFFCFWFYQEYQYNLYFQAYVNDFFIANELFLVAVLGVIIFFGLSIGMYVRKKEHLQVEVVEHETGPSMKGGRLDTGTEQHLINMIRKNMPAGSGSTSNPPPASTGTTPAAQTPAAHPAPTGNMPTLPSREEKKP